MAASRIVLTCFFLVLGAAAFPKRHVGQPCLLDNGQPSKCRLEKKCPAAIEGKYRGERFAICGFRGFAPLVCCPNTPKLESPETTPPNPIQTTPEITQNSLEPTIEPSTVAPSSLTTSTVSPKVEGNVGDKAAAACRRNMENWIPAPNAFLFGGEDAELAEFPHMALIGYEADENQNTLGRTTDGRKVSWRCGGTLVSDSFVLTAAHCVAYLGALRPQVVRLGDLDWASDSDGAEPQDFGIARIVLQPQFRSQERYHDLALLQLDRPVRLSPAVQPACLPSPGDTDLDGKIFTLTGWGDLGEGEGVAEKVRSRLMKTQLSVLPLEVCNRTYMSASDRAILPRALLPTGHLCVQNEFTSSDCQGDSGGPLQELVAGSPLYRVVGVVSIGKSCDGVAPGLYAKVADYVGWIEGVVWP